MTDLEWFLDGISAEIPRRMVSRRIADDGGPSLSGELIAYLMEGQHRDSCAPVCHKEHWSKSPDPLNIWRLVYDRPFVRAIRLAGQSHVPKGRPRYNEVLWAVALNGSPEMAIDSLRTRWPYMWNRNKARRHIEQALLALRAVYREDHVPARGKSESQSIAEAA